MEMTWITVLMCLIVSLEIVSAGTYTDRKMMKSDAVKNHDQSHREPGRLKSRLGFWERFYDQYFHEENYFTSGMDIFAQPRVFNILKETLSHRTTKYETLPKGAREYLDNSMAQNFDELSREYFKEFRPLDEMIAFMKEAAAFCRGRCSLFDVGRSYEGRPMIGIKITTESKGGPNKPKMWIDAGTHAREWIAHTSALYLADMLITKYDHDYNVRHLVDNYEWYILPCVNPDGYNYTWTTDRLWRKTRTRIPGTECIGVDANRNFDYKWGQKGSAGDPCSNNFRGVAPFSEPETRNIKDFMLSPTNNGTWLMFLTLHAKGQLVMSPWGYTKAEPGDYTELRRVGAEMAYGMTQANHMPYWFGTAANVLYSSAGTSRDWARGSAKIKYVYTIELRDKTKKTWVLPSWEIIPTGDELWQGLLRGMNAIEMRKDREEFDLGEFTTHIPRPTTSTARPDYLKRYSPHRAGGIPIAWLDRLFTDGQARRISETRDDQCAYV